MVLRRPFVPPSRATAQSAMAALSAALFSAACGPAGSASPEAPSTSTTAAAAPTADLTPAERKAREERAQALFLTECAACHGEQGGGDGPVAVHLTIKPRDFLHDKLRLRSTASGVMATRKDIFRTITQGMPGTTMIPFAFLSEEERWLLTDHVWKLSMGLSKRLGGALPATAEPPNDAASLARGKAMYEKLECGKCHGPGGAGDGPRSTTLRNDLGWPDPARDLVHDPFRGGDTAEAVALRLRTGMDGTPMASIEGAVSPDEIWDLAHHVVALRLPEDPAPMNALAYGHRVLAEKRCDGCHVLEGKGAPVGPSLDVAAQKLSYAWAKGYLAAPRAHGKIYPFLPYTMPDFGLGDREIDAILTVFARIANRQYPEPPEAPVALDPSRIDRGKQLYSAKCAGCHDLGTVVKGVAAKPEGPDLIEVARRLRFDFTAAWVESPHMSPGARKPAGKPKDDPIRAVVEFVWKTSLDAQAGRAAGQPGGPAK